MNKNILFKCVVTLLIVIILLNCFLQKNVYASEETTSGLDTFTGMIIEPTVEFFTFFIDSIMTVFGNIMTPQEIEFVMQDDPIDVGETGTTKTFDNEEAYENFIGNINVKYPNFVFSSEEIFSKDIELLDINFISNENSNEGWINIRKTIASWYKALRLFVMVGLLSMLIYTGIKIMVSSTAQDKAKYKERIINWFVAVILLFLMHYIMAFILTIVDEISELLGELNGTIRVSFAEGNIDTFTTNLIGLARFQMQQKNFSAKIGFLVIYVALVVYTFKFTFLYIKRMLNMAFLTLIAPLIALMYPLDKMDGKSKTFQLWIKEFVYNALLRPMHHLLYYILVSSALTLAASNPIYGIIAIAFISNAEKLLKSIFGFDKAREGTVEGIAGAYATGSLVSSMTSFLKNPFHIGNSHNEKDNNDARDEDEQFSYRKIEDVDIESMFMENENVIDNYEEENINSIYTNQENSNNVNSDIEVEKDIRSENPFININSEYTDINKLMQEYRRFLLQSNDIDFSEYEFKDEESRSLKELFERIAKNQEKLKNSEKLGLHAEEIEKIKDEITKDKNMLNNEIWMSELPFKLEQIPLNYSDNDNRSCEQISDDILRHMEMARDPQYSLRKQRRYKNMTNKDMKLLNNRIAQNNYIDNYRRNKGIQQENSQIRENIDNRIDNDINKEVKEENKQPRIMLGMKNVGKSMLKPVWDMDRSVNGNTERLLKNVAKGAIGLAVGSATAAVQAGISITDGKYNALEGVGSFTAGALGGINIVDAGGRKVDNEIKNNEKIEGYSKRWYDRDDVITYYNNEYGRDAKDIRRRARDNYVTRGIIDFKEQKQAIKFANQLIKEGKNIDEADKIAVATLKYKQELIQSNSYSTIYDLQKRNKYLETKVDQYNGNKSKVFIRNRHDTFLENVRRFDRINNI